MKLSFLESAFAGDALSFKKLGCAGTAEDAGLFCTIGKARTSMTKYDCTRVKLDRFMVSRRMLHTCIGQDLGTVLQRPHVCCRLA